MRQWYKHVVGIETTSNSATKDHAWNEISGRYVPVEDFYTPSVFRKQSEDNKQATEGAIEEQELALNKWNEVMSSITDGYHELLDMGVGKEQARAILPLNQYTEVYWTASFQAIMNFIELRAEKTSQWEIQEYAKTLQKLMFDVFPKTTKIWSEVNGWL
jgi:thymidylate synthase (FAD)